MVPARRCGPVPAAAINAAPGPPGSKFGGAPMSRRLPWPTRMPECCGVYSEAAKAIEWRPVALALLRLLVERNVASATAVLRSHSILATQESLSNLLLPARDCAGLIGKLNGEPVGPAPSKPVGGSGPT